MVRDLSCRGQAVVTALTVRRQSRVIETGRIPCEGGVAVVALTRRGHMAQGLRGGAHTIVAAQALALL